MKGQHVCRMHGGASRRARAAAERRLAEAEAQRALDAMKVYGTKADVSPIDALLEEVRWTAGHVAWLRERVREVEQKALITGVTEQKIDPQGGRTVKIETTAHVWLELYQRERTHLTRVCTAAIRAGIEERQVKLAERQGALVADVIEAILADLALSPEQVERIPDVVPRHLQALAGGAA